MKYRLIAPVILLIMSFWFTAATAQQIKPPPINPVQDKSSLKLPGSASVRDDQGKYFQEKFLPSLTSLIISGAGGMALLFVIIGGIQILTAYGNDEKIAAAKKTITWALAGLLIAILSYSIVQIIVSIRI